MDTIKIEEKRFFVRIPCILVNVFIVLNFDLVFSSKYIALAGTVELVECQSDSVEAVNLVSSNPLLRHLYASSFSHLGY